MLPCPYLNVFFFFSPPTGFLFLPGPPVRSCYRVAEGGMLSPPPALPGPGQEGFLKDLAAGPLLISGLQRWQERPWSWVLSWAPAAREFLSVIFQSSPGLLCASVSSSILLTFFLLSHPPPSLVHPPPPPPFIFLAYLGAQSEFPCLRRPRPPQTDSVPSQFRLTLRPPPHGTF